MRLFILLLSIPIFGQVTITPSAANSITDRGARVNMTLSSSAYVYAEFGPTTGYGSRSAGGNPGTTNAVIVLSGLAPGGTTHYRICQTGFTPPTGCTVDQTLVTLAAQSVAPVAPTQFDTAYPVSFTAPSYTVDSDCSNLQAHLNTAKARDGNENILITIPVGTTCGGKFFGPVKTGANPNGTGQIVIASDGMLPPAGTRIDPSYYTNGQMVRFLQTTVQDGFPWTSNPATCTPLYFQFRTDLGDTWQICTAVNTWQAVSDQPGYTTGSTVPSAASCDNIAEVGRYYERTGVGRSGLYYCHSSLHWFPVGDDGNSGYAFSVPGRYDSSTVTGYRLVGIYFESMWPTAPGLAEDSTFVYAETGANRFIVDRCVFNYQRFTAPHTSTPGVALAANGVNIAMIDSYVLSIPAGSSPNVNITAGTGPFKVSNNYLSGCFINVFVNDSDPTVPRSDITISGNYITLAPQCNPADALYDGLGDRSTRGFLEFKRGTRVLVNGNTFFNGYASSGITVGASLIFSPRAGTSTGGDDNAYQISDVDITNNEFRHITGGVEVWGQDNQWYRNTRLTARFRFANNLGYDIDGRTYSSTQMRGPFFYVQDGISGLTITNNTWYNSLGTAPALMTFTAAMGAVNFSNNVGWANLNDLLVTLADVFRWSNETFSTLCDGTTAQSSASYTTRLDKCMIEGVTPFYTAANNAIVGGYAGATADMVTKGIPASTILPGDTTTGITNLGFINTAVGNYDLKFTSTYAASGIGMDQSAIQQASGQTLYARARLLTNNGATMSYTAPTTTSCSVDHGTSASFATYTRTSDTPAGVRPRNVAVSGYGSGVVVYWRVNCAQSVTGSFTTL